MKVITLFEIMKLGTFFVPEQIDLYNKDLDSKIAEIRQLII